MRTKTLTDNIYDELKSDILESKIKPGEKLTEMMLAERFEVSRAPIRDVIGKLKQEGLVIVKPQIGTIVSPISLPRAKEILEVRMLLEPYAAREAVRNIDEDDMEMLAFTFERFEKQEKNGNNYIKLYYETDEKMHQTIWKWCDNQEIRDILTHYRGEIRRIRVSNSELAHKLLPSGEDLKAIGKAIFERSPEAAEKAMYNHLANTKTSLTEFLAAYENMTSD